MAGSDTTSIWKDPLPLSLSTTMELQHLLQKAQFLASLNRHKEAYALLQQFNHRYEGITAYDFLLAGLAMKNQDFDYASFVLERLSQLEPRRADLRMQLAIAYFHAGENEQARLEFERLQPVAPPKALTTIEQYLQAINQRALDYDYGWHAAIQLTTGYDNNANASTEETQFLGFELAQNNQQTGSALLATSINVGVHLPTAVDERMTASWLGYFRHNPAASFVDQLNNTLDFRYVWSAQQDKLATFAQLANTQLDGGDQASRYSLGVFSSVAWTSQWVLNNRLKVTQTEYTDNLAILDGLNIAWQGQLQKNQVFNSAGSLATQLGYELVRADQSESAYSNQQIKIGFRYINHISQNWQVSAQAQLRLTEYDQPFFGQTRKDQRSELALQFKNPVFWQQWGLSVLLQHSHNESDIPLYELDRSSIALSIERLFI